MYACLFLFMIVSKPGLSSRLDEQVQGDCILLQTREAFSPLSFKTLKRLKRLPGDFHGSTQIARAKFAVASFNLLVSIASNIPIATQGRSSLG